MCPDDLTDAINDTVAALPLREQEALLRHAEHLRARAAAAQTAEQRKELRSLLSRALEIVNDLADRDVPHFDQRLAWRIEDAADFVQMADESLGMDARGTL